MLATADAALIIGDPALTVPRERYVVLDLAGEWLEMTGLPFVFAVWAARDEVATAELVAPFTASLETGLAELDAIVDGDRRRNRPRPGGPPRLLHPQPPLPHGPRRAGRPRRIPPPRRKPRVDLQFLHASLRPRLNGPRERRAGTGVTPAASGRRCSRGR